VYTIARKYMHAVTLAGVAHSYNDTSVLEDITLSVADGEFVAVVGPSGCGKSTLLNIVCGLLIPTQGSVTVLNMQAQKARMERRCGISSQDPVLLPWRTVYENIRLPLEITGTKDDGRITDIVGQVGLTGFESHYPHELSGGMQQRVALARTLLHEPHVLLFDEPFAALDELTRTRMGIELLELWRGSARRTVLFVTHSTSEAALLADRVVVLSERPARIKEVISVALPRPRTHEHVHSRPHIDALSCIHEAIRS